MSRNNWPVALRIIVQLSTNIQNLLIIYLDSNFNLPYSICKPRHGLPCRGVGGGVMGRKAQLRQPNTFMLVSLLLIGYFYLF